MPTVDKYNATWRVTDWLQVEMECIKRGGQWVGSEGQTCGEGLFHHIKAMQTMLWPDKKWHRWNELLLKAFIENKMIGVMGSASSGKTSEAADYALTQYFCFPLKTSVLVSSTDLRGLELRIWGQIKRQFEIAKSRYEWLPGFAIGSRLMITSSSREQDIRDFRNGIVGIPCMSGGTYVGLKNYVGVKNKFVLQVADELQFMNVSFLDASANLSKNESYQLIGLGNPLDRENPLAKLCEPPDEIGGWDGLGDGEKTRSWKTKFPEGIAIQLIGTDSPNFDVPADQPIPFPFLISRKHIERDLAYYGRDSLQFTMMNLGVLPKDSSSRRVITRELCVQHHAMEPIVWGGGKLTKILGLDAAYSAVGGDRCVLTEVNFGEDVSGNMMLAVVDKPIIVPITVKGGPAEDQIAAFVMREAIARGIPPENVFYDSTGRGTLGTAFARAWSAAVNPVEFGGKASDRPVSAEDRTLCKDRYGKFVSELWYVTRHIIEADRLRGLPEDIMREGCMREWKLVAGNRIDVETKDETKKRMGRSPDIYDSFVVAVEGARRRGFTIGMMGKQRREETSEWLDDLIQRKRKLNRRNTLMHHAA